MSNKICAAAVLTVLSGCTTVPTVYQAAALDTGSTALALSRGAVELNPAGAVGTIVLKAAYITGVFGARNAQSDRIAVAVWTGAAVNNVVGIFLLNPIVAATVGVSVGIHLYTVQKLPEK